MKLSEHIKDGEFGGYKKFIYGKMFYFGKATPKDRAEQIASALKIVAGRLKAENRGWEENEIADAFDLAVGTVHPKATAPIAPVAVAAPPVPSSRTTKGMTVQDGIDAYLAERRMDLQAKQITASWLRAIEDRLNYCVRFNDFAALSIAEVGYDKLIALVKTIIGRPVSQKTTKPISAKSAIGYVSALQQFFDWLDKSGKWEGFKRWQDVFDFDRRKMKRAEGRRQPIQTFTPEELRMLYQRASGTSRLHIGLGLFCGFTQIDIAELKRFEVIEKNGETYIEKGRNKTDIPGRWWLPPQVATDLKVMMEKTAAKYPKSDYALLTREGNRQVHFNQAGIKTDTIHLAWLRTHSNIASYNEAAKTGAGSATPTTVRPLGFKFLRKTGSQMVRDIAGLEVSQIFLAQSNGTMAEKHYNNRSDAEFSKVEEAQKKMAVQLKTIFEPLPDPLKVKPKA